MHIEEPIKVLSALNSEPKSGEHPFEIGADYIIETVTKFYTGTLVDVMPQEIVLKDAAWIADTGRYSDSFTSSFKEVEPLPEGLEIIGRGSIVSARKLQIILPRIQK